MKKGSPHANAENLDSAQAADFVAGSDANRRQP